MDLHDDVGERTGVEWRARPFLTVCAIAAAAMAIIAIGIELYLFLPGERPSFQGLGAISNALHPNAETNLFAWFSVALLGLLSLAFVGLAFAHWHTPDRARYGVLAVIAMVLSADEGGALHERLGSVPTMFGLDFGLTYLWLLVGAPLAVVVGAVLLWLARPLPGRLVRRLVLAGVLYLLGAIAFEALGGFLMKNDIGLSAPELLLAHSGAVLVEELLEVAGILVALWGAFSELRIVRGRDGVSVTARSREAV